MTDPETKWRVPAPVALGVAVVAISAAAILIREAEAAAVSIAFWRTAGGAIVLAPVAAMQRRALRSLSRRDGLLLIGSGACLGLHFALWLGSLELTTVASSVTLVTMSPLFVALLSTLFLGESTSRAAWAGIAITVVGAAIIGLGDSSDPGETNNAVAGDLMALGGAAAMAGYILIGRRLRRSELPNTVFAVPTYAVAAVGLLIVALLRSEQLAGFATSTWLILAALVAGPQLLGHAMLTSVLDRIRATTVAVATLLEPIGATILAWIVLDEVPASLFWLGAPVVLAGLAVTLRSGSDDLSQQVMDTV